MNRRRSQTRLETTTQDAADILFTRLVGARANVKGRAFVLGVSGAQGSGKTTLAERIVATLENGGERAVALSLDDFYHARATRRGIAASASPLLVTRGPPGTHDIALAASVVKSIKQGETVSVPVFDKGADDRKEEWRRIDVPVDVVVLEGWCLGAAAQPETALAVPINMLERVFDRDGNWRRAVDGALRSYEALFAEIDFLAYLRPPTFDVVHVWRLQQELSLIGVGPAAMSADELSFFIQHYERLTRWMMAELPSRADLTLQLDARRRVASVATRSA